VLVGHQRQPIGYGPGSSSHKSLAEELSVYPINAAAPERIAVGSIYLIADGTIQTTGASVRVMGQGGAAGAGGGTLACDTTSGGWYYTPTQAETNYTSFMVFIYKASCTSASISVVTTASSVPGNVQLAAAQPAVTFSAVTVTNATTLSGAVSCGSTFDVVGALTANSVSIDTTVDVVGALTCASFGVDGAVTVGTTTTLTGAVSLGSTLGVTGTTTLAAITQTGAVSLGATTFASITVTGAVSIGTTLTITGATTFAAITAGAIGATSLTCSGTIQAATITSTGATTFNSLVVSTTTTLTGAVAITDITTAGSLGKYLADILGYADNLPSDPADQSAVEAAITAATSGLATASALATVAGYIDTEIQTIISYVDCLPATWVTVPTATEIVTAMETNGSKLDVVYDDWLNNGRLDLLVDAIKATTDKLDTMMEVIP